MLRAPRASEIVSSAEPVDGQALAQETDVVVAELGEQPEIERALDLDRAERAQVRRQVLQLEQAAARLREACDEIGQGDLGGIGRAVEHRLAAEHAAHEHPVDAPYETVAVPDLEAVRVAQPVQARVCSRELLADPRTLLATARRTAPGHDGLERL